jgi:hypothetical protein
MAATIDERHIRHLGRDPYVRANLMRVLCLSRKRAIEAKAQCAWCGQTRGLYYYIWVPDSLTTQQALRWAKHAFCSKQCWEAHAE